MRFVRSMTPCEPVIHIDDSDVVKPEGYHFESLGIVRDGSKSTPEKSVYCKGCHVTEACVLTCSNHPVSIFSRRTSFTRLGLPEYLNHPVVPYSSKTISARLATRELSADTKIWFSNSMILDALSSTSRP